MKKISTDKRLQLVRAIRLQNQYDRQLFRSRQQLLYDIPPKRGELYSLESDASLSGKDMGNYQDGLSRGQEGDRAFMTGFKIRLAIAIALLVAFVFCDNRQISIQGTTTQELFEKMTESLELPFLSQLWD